MLKKIYLQFFILALVIASCFSFIFRGNYMIKSNIPKKFPLFDGKIEGLESKKEILSRSYPFINKSLPLLDDVNNYYSGKYGDLFWHQNSHQVYVFFPLNNDISKRDINVKFDVMHVKVDIKGQDTIEFDCLDRIITDGSFWVIEKDIDGNKYLMLDLEKRFGSLNWNGLFERHSDEELDKLRKNSKFLDSMLAANQGLSKMTGLPPETIEELLKDEKFLQSLNSTISETPQISAESYSGETFDLGSQDIEGLGISSDQLQEIIQNSKNRKENSETIIDAEIA